MALYWTCVPKHLIQPTVVRVQSRLELKIIYYPIGYAAQLTFNVSYIRETKS